MEIAGVQVPVIDFFEESEVANLDEWKRSMTLQDLLTMRAGIAWDEDTVPYTDPENSCAGMENSDDWIRFVVNQPMSHQPGTVFVYNSGASELLALIIKKSTGKHVDEYAEEHLFGPLGITGYFWKKTPTGYPDTEGGLYLAAGDLAKIGYLYLMDGVWDQVRVLPEGWVAASTERRVEDTGWLGMGYGYQWWLVPWGARAALSPMQGSGTEGSTCSWCRNWISSQCSRDGTSMIPPISTRTSLLTPWSER